MQFKKDVRIRHEKFGAVLFETLKEEIFVTNETGADILRLLQKNRQSQEVIAELIKGHDCDAGTIKGQTEEFILSLKEKGIIEETQQK